MTLPDNDMVNPGDGPLRPEPWGLFFFIAIIIFSGHSEPAVCSLQHETGPSAVLQNSANKSECQLIAY